MSNINFQIVPTESLDPTLILHSRIELKTWTGDVKIEIKSFYDAIEHALQDTSLDIQKQERLNVLKEMPEDTTDLTKFDGNDPLRIEVIDISYEWARSYLKNDTIDFLKVTIDNFNQ
ncbi:9106_t:CDS:2 [Racocetra fulgida]|uniref:9106_t:CDS:1 n=1 Tax=Racocetra fulgida TaxID=60492 RepID=A0A9N9ABQ4_9GLOM|nr:9106_t:CDS:2 [Racocetra fulgida]